MPRIKPKQLVFNVAIFSLIVLAFIYRERLYLEYYTFFNYIDNDAIFKSSQRNFTKINHVFKSVCNCRKEVIYLDKTDNAYQVSFINIGHHDSNLSQSKEKIFQYEVPIDTFESATFLCDMYHVLRRGPNSKVISYSLYGKNRFYYDLLFSIADLVEKYYRDWTVRIYYDETIDKSIICEIECLKQKNNMNLFYDNVDFCNIEKLPYDTSKTWNARYMHGMTWRWLPIGDSFVDFVASRDTDAWISKRELDSVKVWMESNTVFHVMRDAPVHNIPIIGGYWGFANVRDRPLSEYFLKVLTNKHVARYYNKNMASPKQHDQWLLTKYFASHMYENATIHDAYLCYWLGGKPWPTKRPIYNCFVGCSQCCDQIEDGDNFKYNKVCPRECRPKEHQDWIYC